MAKYLAIVLLLACASQAYAQTRSAELEGDVWDGPFLFSVRADGRAA
jgi:hypothetical protein